MQQNDQKTVFLPKPRLALACALPFIASKNTTFLLAKNTVRI